MSVKSERVFWVECDHAAPWPCGERTGETDTAGHALVLAGRQLQRFEGKWYCRRHRQQEAKA